MLEIFIIVFKVNSSYELNLIFLCFSSNSSLVGTSVKYLFPLISSKYPFPLPKKSYKRFTLIVFTDLESFIVTYPL